jgi:hypothetical protein
MARISENYEMGNLNDLTPPEMARRIQEMYTQLARAINQKPDLVFRDSDGDSGDTFLSNGTINVNTSTLKVEMLTEHPTTSTVTWTTLS